MIGNAELLVGFFLFVLASAGAAGYLFMSRRETVEAARVEIPDELMHGGSDDPGIRTAMFSVLRGMGELVPSSETGRISLEKRLSYAGYRGVTAASAYVGVKCASAGTLAMGCLAASIVNGGDAGMMFSALLCGAGIGFLLPERVLDALIRARNNRLRRSLPPALDLMVMSLEAGQPLDQALLLASRGLQRFSPDLSNEFAQVVMGTRASKSRAEALIHLAERNSEPEIRKFCSLLLDSDRFGSSLAPTLRQHAKYMRVRFRQNAQESARKLTVKMVFPVFFLIFPAILVVTLGPAVLTMFKYFATFSN